MADQKTYNVGSISILILLVLLSSLLSIDAAETKLDELNERVGHLIARDKFSEAIPVAIESVAVSEREFGNVHAQTAASLRTLAFLYDRAGNCRQAELLYQRALLICRKVLAPNSPDIAALLNDLGLHYGIAGDYAKAESLLQEALTMCGEVLPSDDSRIAGVLTSLGNVYLSTGELVKARELFERVLVTKNHDAKDPSFAVDLMNLANVYCAAGDYAEAEQLYQRGLGIFEQAFGQDNSKLIPFLADLGMLYSQGGNYTKAAIFFERALSISQGSNGKQRTSAAVRLPSSSEWWTTPLLLNNLALVQRNIGDDRRAESLLRRALQMVPQDTGVDMVPSLIFLNLAQLRHEAGDLANAKSFYQRSLHVFERLFGPKHFYSGLVLSDLARLHFDEGKRDQATPMVERIREIERMRYKFLLSFASERHRLAAQESMNPYATALVFGDTSELAECILRYKGAVLDSLLEDRSLVAVGNSRQRNLIDDLGRAKEQLTAIVLEPSKSTPASDANQREAKKRDLFKRVEQMEGELTHRAPSFGQARRALGVTVDQIQNSLSENEALIEWLRYNDYSGNDKWQPRYGAMLITASREPMWVPIGSAAEIEKDVGGYQNSLQGKTDPATLNAALRTIYETIWAPVERVLPSEIRSIILCPDGDLNFVSFAALPNATESFVGERYYVRYASGGRDLLREKKFSDDRSMVVYANPDFGAQQAGVPKEFENTFALASNEMRDIQGLSLPALPGTALEAIALEECGKQSGLSTRLFVQSNATEAELRKVNRPHILHLATHGFFLPVGQLDDHARAFQLQRDFPMRRIANPMRRSGLALAGAQRTLQLWGEGKRPPAENDGILTAEEVSGLKLDGTWLVVLSACDTGSGEARSGEGVMGLRRGFVQAGTQNLLMTLWPISDQTTVQIMLDFYDAALKSGNAPQALADVQRDWLVKLRKERGLLPAVQLAGPFIMSSQGKQ